jgi:hypothetical protein
MERNPEERDHEEPATQEGYPSISKTGAWIVASLSLVLVGVVTLVIVDSGFFVDSLEAWKLAPGSVATQTPLVQDNVGSHARDKDKRSSSGHGYLDDRHALLLENNRAQGQHHTGKSWTDLDQKADVVDDSRFWDFVQGSKSASDYEMYLLAFPTGKHAAEALTALKDLGSKAVTVSAASGPESAQFASVDEARKQLPLGPVVFNVPTPVDIDDDCPCRIDAIVSAIDEDPKKLESAIKSENPAAKNFQSAKIRVSPRMVASLSASPDDFDVNPKGDQEQDVGFGEPANWTWTIVPKTWGPHVLMLTMKANVMINGKAEAVSLKTFSKPILVAVTPFGRAKHLADNHIEFVWGSFLLPFLGFLGWLWKKKIHPKPEPTPRNPRHRP